MEDVLQVGVVTSTHGLAGDVKVFPTTDDPARFKKLKTVLLAETDSRQSSRTAKNRGTGQMGNARHAANAEKNADHKNSGISDESVSAAAMRELEVERVKFFKNMVILKFRGLDRIEDVENFRGCSLFVTRENAVELEEGEYFIADLIGLTVYTDGPWEKETVSVGSEDDHAQLQEGNGHISVENGVTLPPGVYPLGELTDVLQTGANDVYEVTLTDERTLLIPAIRQCILAVDIEKGTMLVHLLEGLLE